MPLAGQHEIIITVIDCLGWPAGDMRRQRRQDGRKIALTFLAAEGAAHAPCLDGHGMVRQAEAVGHLVLDLGRVLRRAMQRHVPVLARNGERRLPLEIEMFLPADLDPAGQRMLRAGKRRIRTARFHRH